MPETLRVLQVEDNEDDAILIQGALHAHYPGLLCRRVEDELNLRRHLEEQAWDIVLCDYSLPSLNAPRVLRIMGERGFDIPLIIISGAVGEEAAVEAVKLGAEDFLSKNNLGRLGRVVERSLDAAENRRRRRAAEEALLRSETRFRQVVENIAEVFWVLDLASGKLVYLSPSYERVWGRRAEEVLADVDVWRNSIHPDDRTRVLDNARERHVSGRYNEVYRIHKPDGTLRWVRDKAFPLANAEGVVHTIIGLAEDITEQKQMEVQFLHAQRMDALGTLASGVAHDLNNILSPLMIATELLKNRLMDEDDRHLLTMMDTQARRGADIIKQLLTFSRGIGGKRVCVQLRHLIREMANVIRETFPREIELRTQISGDLWTIIADPTQMHQVLLNLCVNARDAMPEGGLLQIDAQNIQLEASSRFLTANQAPGPYVVVSVQDDGCGMSLDVQQRIFDPFFTTKPIGKGTGLGLSTVLGIINAHDGILTFDSEPGKGTIFRYFIPAQAVDELTLIQDEKLSQKHGHGELVLVVDDEPSIRETLRALLVNAGYRVITAIHGQDGLKQFLHHQGDLRLVVTDLMMPVMNGMVLIQTLRSLDPKLSIIASSGLDSSSKVGDLEKLGVSRLLVKPYDSETFLNEVSAELAESSSRREDAGCDNMVTQRPEDRP